MYNLNRLGDASKYVGDVVEDILRNTTEITELQAG